jgi:hypothetical protein
MRVFAKQLRYSIIATLTVISAWQSSALAQGDHDHQAAAAQQAQTPQQKRQAGALVKAVREVTAIYQDPAVAQSQQYSLIFGCVSGGDFGAMGMHFLNSTLLDSEIDINKPEILLYEPLPNGRLRLTGADYLVTKEAWESNPEHTGPPELMGQLFHLFDSPNRFGLPPFYTLHVWAWKDNPNGTFTNWNPAVSCDAFGGEQ